MHCHIIGSAIALSRERTSPSYFRSHGLSCKSPILQHEQTGRGSTAERLVSTSLRQNRLEIFAFGPQSVLTLTSDITVPALQSQEGKSSHGLFPPQFSFALPPRKVIGSNIAKVRCSRTKPTCQRCVSQGIECVYPERVKRKARRQISTYVANLPRPQGAGDTSFTDLADAENKITPLRSFLSAWRKSNSKSSLNPRPNVWTKANGM